MRSEHFASLLSKLPKQTLTIFDSGGQLNQHHHQQTAHLDRHRHPGDHQVRHPPKLSDPSQNTNSFFLSLFFLLFSPQLTMADVTFANWKQIFFCSLSLPLTFSPYLGPENFPNFSSCAHEDYHNLNTCAHSHHPPAAKGSEKSLHISSPSPNNFSPEKLKRHSHFRFSSGDTSFRSYFCCETFEPLFFSCLAWLGSGKCLPLILSFFSSNFFFLFCFTTGD